MRLLKIVVFLLATAVVAGSVAAQDEVIARAYRTVNVRSGPGTQYDTIGQLTSGNEVKITGRSDEESDWLRVEFDGREGWVAYFTVSVLGDTSGLSVVEPISDMPDAMVPVIATPTMLHAQTNIYVTAYRAVNVRSGPGIDYVRLGNLESGSTVDVTGRSNDNEWLRINYAGKSGWVAFFVVSLTGSLDDVNVVEPPAGAETEAVSTTMDVVTRYNVNLHEQPALDSPILDVVPFDTTLKADARSDEDSTWLEVNYDDQAGWLLRILVNLSAALDNLPVK